MSEENEVGENTKPEGSKGGKKWKCPNPDCGKWSRGEQCTDCGTTVDVYKSLDQLKRDRRGGRGSGGGGGRKYGGKGNWRDGGGRGRNRDAVQKISNSTCPVVHMFEGIREILDARHDKMERIVKISRDITIESKRIIFTLHRIRCEEDKQHVLLEAEQRFSGMKRGLWRNLALELREEDHYQFLRNYTAGLQEWIEALSFYHYMCYDKLISWEEVQKELEFTYFRSKKNSDQSKREQRPSEFQPNEQSPDTQPDENQKTSESNEENKPNDVKENQTVKNESDTEEVKENKPDVNESQATLKSDKSDQTEIENKKAKSTEDQTVNEHIAENEEESKKEKTDDLNSNERKPETERDGNPEPTDRSGEKEEGEVMIVTVPQNDYILGLADLTGELMRNAINSLSSGEMEACFVLLHLLQSIYSGFLMVQQDAPHQVSKKMYTLKQSLRKVEDACYAINVRGSEIPKSHLADIFEQSSDVPNFED